MSTKGHDAYQHAIAEVGKVYEDAPDGESLLQTILVSFSKYFNNPPTRCFEEILQKNFTIEELRCAMFLPSDDQVRYYPTILHMTRNLPSDRVSELRVRSIILSLVYLVHRKSWSFLKEFVLCGGLGEISWMITDENLYLRGQAFEVLLSITDCDTFDWFQHHEGNTATRALHHRLMGLSQHPNFLTGLLDNRTRSYPGGSLRALQLLAFWISWVRAVNTTNHILTLSDSMLRELKLWSEGQGEDLCEDEINLAKTIYSDFSYEQFHREDTADLRKEMGTGTGTAERNTQLQLCSSDSGVPCDTADASHIDTHSGADRPAVFVSGFETSEYEGCDSDNDATRTLPSLRLNSNGILEHSIAAGISIEETLLATVECETAVSSEEGSIAPSQPPAERQYLEALVEKAQLLKMQGNELFKMLRFTDSLGIYEEAISLLEPMCEGVSHRSEKHHSSVLVSAVTAGDDEISKPSPVIAALMASLHFNCATAHWKLSELKGAVTCSAGADQPPLSHEAKCESSCRSALTFDQTYCKCVYRLSCVLLQQGRSIEALEAIERYAAASTSDLDESVKAVRRRCLAAAMASGEREGEGEGEVSTDKMESNQESLISEAAVAVKKLSLSDRRRASSAIPEAAIGSQAAKVLRALQTRASRGKGSSTAAVPLSLSSYSARDKQGATSRSGRVFDEEDNRNLETLLGKPLEVEVNGDRSSKRGTITPQAVNVSNTQTKKEIAAKKGSKKADAKSSKAATVNACEAYNKLKNLSASFEKSFSSARELLKGDDRASKGGQVEELYDAMDGHVKSAIQALEDIWTENITLKKAMTALVEEEFLHFLLTVAVKCSLHKTDDGESSLSYELLALKLLRQLRTVERFSTIFNLTVYGNEELKTSLGKALDILLRSVQEGKIKSFTAPQNGVAASSDDNLQEKKKAEIDLQKNLESISEIRSLLK